MKQATPTPENLEQRDDGDDDEMREEYDFSAARPNKYVEQYATGTNLVLLAPDVAARFPDSDAVNRALRLLIQLAQQEVKPAPATSEV